MAKLFYATSQIYIGGLLDNVREIVKRIKMNKKFPCYFAIMVINDELTLVINKDLRISTRLRDSVRESHRCYS